MLWLLLLLWLRLFMLLVLLMLLLLLVSPFRDAAFSFNLDAVLPMIFIPPLKLDVRKLEALPIFLTIFVSVPCFFCSLSPSSPSSSTSDALVVSSVQELLVVGANGAGGCIVGFLLLRSISFPALSTSTAVARAVSSSIVLVRRGSRGRLSTPRSEDEEELSCSGAMTLALRIGRGKLPLRSIGFFFKILTGPGAAAAAGAGFRPWSDESLLLFS
jgi:hypothetical protein